MTPTEAPHNPTILNQGFTVNREVMRQIQSALQGLEYGHISLTIHNGRLIQIDRIQKLRLERRASRQ